MKKILLYTLVLVSCLTYAQQSLNVNFISNYSYPIRINDVWGYEKNGNEYALVGVFNGFSVVNVTNGQPPVQELFISGANSVWRDIKTYSHYAYVVHDFFSGTSNGILIVDLDSLQGATPTFTEFFPTVTVDTAGPKIFSTAHNIYIDENGILYVFGSNIGVGGALMFDLTADPTNPTFLGSWNEVYLHDGMAKGDTLWGAAVLEGRFFAIDVSTKTNPITMGSKITPNSFTHNIWVSDDNKTVFTTDELPGSYVASYDVSDLNNIEELDKKRSAIGTDSVIPHNAHVYGDFVVNSFYTSGLQILDATYPDIMVEVGYYDTSDSVGKGFNGAWGAYPYLPSGNVLVTDIQEGLFVLDPAYLKGCYLEVNVVDSVTKNNVPGAFVKVLNTDIDKQASIFGKVRAGVEAPNTYDLVVSKSGYITDTVSVTLTRGVLLTKRVALRPLNFDLNESVFGEVAFYPNPSNQQITLESNKYFGEVLTFEVFDNQGKRVLLSHPNTEHCTLQHNLPSGVYQVKITTKKGALKPKKLLVL